ncbi:hypothetical protein Dsin_007204 [Dipteronia sinensis]|uniref:Uncharacterized protein n=1 Tax=Dipteronia sinensis TaxID=43782 RepID=A0AAE0B038_9ROSI|nr:hypothetical protein Dsin_007204 [Dipteronia sinensis]
MVTSASSGIGQQLCLVAVGRRIERLKTLYNNINSSATSPHPPRDVGMELDVSADEATMERYVDEAWQEFKKIDTLVNNGGVRGIKVFHFFL